MTIPGTTTSTPPEQAGQPRRRSTVLLLAMLVLLVSLATDLRVLPADGALGQDFNDFYVAASAQQQGQNPYDGKVLTRFEQRLFGQASFSNTVASPPAFFVAFRPFLAITPRQGLIVWLILSSAALVSALLVLGQVLGIARSGLLWALAAGPPTIIAAFLGQISLVLVACYLWAIMLLHGRRPLPAGLLLGLTLVKPHLMIVPVALLCALSWRQGGRRMAAATLGCVALLCLAAIPLAEPGSTGHWIDALRRYGSTFDRWQPDISSLAGIYLPYLPRNLGRALSTALTIGGLAGAGLLVRQAWTRHLRIGEHEWWRLLALGTALWLLALPYIHPYDDTLALAPLLILLAMCKGEEPRGAAMAAIVAFMSLPELDLMGFRPNLTFSYTVIAMALLVAALAIPAGAGIHGCDTQRDRP